MSGNEQVPKKAAGDPLYSPERGENETTSSHAHPCPLDPLAAFVLQGADHSVAFQSWLNLSPDAIVIVDSAGLLTFINGQVEMLFGYSSQELLGQPLEVLLPERFRAAHIHHREDFAASPRVRPMGIGLELYGLRKDGTEVPIDISLSPIHFDETFYVLAAIRNVTERHRMQSIERAARALSEARLELLQLILDELPIGVSLIQGEQVRLVLANRATTAIWGAQWPVGQAMQDFLTSSNLQLFSDEGHPLSPSALATMRALQQRETTRDLQEIIHRADGTAIPVLVNAVALGRRLLTGVSVPEEESTDHPHDTAEPVALVVYQDVTERLEMERRKDEFIGMAGHELRTPLTSIKTYIQWLRRRLQKQADETSVTVLTKIDQQVNQLTRLIGELLDITQIASGHLPRHEETFDLDELVRETTNELERTTEHHQILQGGQGPVQVYADRERIGQVLANLLTNAIKYMPQGGTILVQQTFNEKEVTVSVQDSGIGIPYEKQGHLFERFYRVRSAEHEKFPGLGLGLYLSAEIVKLHRGRIWVESQPGVGSTFFFTLPVKVL